MAQDETTVQALTRRLYGRRMLPDYEWDFSWIPEERVARYVAGYELAREVVRQVLGDDAFEPARLDDLHTLLSRIRSYDREFDQTAIPRLVEDGRLEPFPVFIPEAFELIAGVSEGSPRLVLPAHELLSAFSRLANAPDFDLGRCLVFHPPGDAVLGTAHTLPNGLYHPPIGLSVLLTRPTGLAVRFGASLDDAVDEFRKWAISSNLFRANPRGPRPSQTLDLRHLAVYRFCQGRLGEDQRYNAGLAVHSRFEGACRASSAPIHRTKYGQDLQKDIQIKVDKETEWSRSLNKADDFIAPLVDLCRMLLRPGQGACK
jgi:hypothetical protein